MNDLTPGQALTQLDEIQKLILEHQSKQNYSQGFGSPAEKVKTILREYEDKTVRAFNGAVRVRDDMLSFFRALALVLTMTGEAATHAEKNARLRGAIELLESAIEKLRHQSFEQLFDVYRFPDLFRSDWPTRRLMERIHDLERQVKDSQPKTDEPKGPETDTASDMEPRW